ncbi:hypothetical protein GGX14DRAFT_542994 [Mycena pura]|uniref:Uncharacterized protein n=1 Tax=Mycena pura TaxID=153505 RepID=A0AAD6VFH1_9AGAR|nr:hypothetical protein GGX14DRAFT_542994 [Mycena pura]
MTLRYALPVRWLTIAYDIYPLSRCTTGFALAKEAHAKAGYTGVKTAIAERTGGTLDVLVNNAQIVAAIWDVTIAVLAILVYAGRHRKSHHGGHKLGRTTTQIHVLCGLAVSWSVLTVGLIVQNSRACTRDRTGCGLFTMAHVLACS